MFINVLPTSDVIHCLRAGDYDGVSDEFFIWTLSVKACEVFWENIL